MVKGRCEPPRYQEVIWKARKFNKKHTKKIESTLHVNAWNIMKPRHYGHVHVICSNGSMCSLCTSRSMRLISTPCCSKVGVYAHQCIFWSVQLLWHASTIPSQIISSKFGFKTCQTQPKSTDEWTKTYPDLCKDPTKAATQLFSFLSHSNNSLANFRAAASPESLNSSAGSGLHLRGSVPTSHLWVLEKVLRTGEFVFCSSINSVIKIHIIMIVVAAIIITVGINNKITSFCKSWLLP